ncbi:MAG: GlsB/YeaQ/YmgE family stress response membrane protein [Candidatus Saccharimonadales bacterium]
MDGPVIIMTLIVGGLAGWLASLIMKTAAQQGLVMNVIVGIIGSFIGSIVFEALGFEVDANIIGRLIVATVGAVILLAIVRALRR